MNNNNFKRFLISNSGIDEHEVSSILKSCSIRKVKKNQFLLKAGEYCKTTFFVETGLLRQFHLDNSGKEHIISFAPESWFVTDRESTYFDNPSTYFIQALEDSEVALINEELIQVLSRELIGFSDFNNRLLHNHIRHLQNRIRLLLSASAEERYLQFVAMYPDILRRVPQAMVASYLGITPESLSRVRRSISTKSI
ncbi:Crp/Fnr family transcriptional regulator [Robertkochia flava]|uniref:Crp/Fnr family transcriptional regulator n=1 Tax=Robertkochia flava TaxID=3447986 RepID=UPI001CCCAF87|nr:Crp/Fnr family transcriptional regulator [Robertkochia marina]